MSAIPFRVKTGGGIESKGTGTFTNGVVFGATETLRLVRGEINDNGEPLGGTGYTCVQNGTGDYTITFNSSFTFLPSPVVTCFDSGVPQIATVYNVAPDSFSVKIWTIGGAAVNSVFYFQAAGAN